MRRLLSPKVSFLVGTFCTVLCGAAAASSATIGAGGSGAVVERTFSALGSQNAALDIRSFFDDVAALNLSRGQLLLSGSVDSATLAAVSAQLKITADFLNVGRLEFEDDTLARLANRILAPDGTIPLRTIELESDRGFNRLADIITLNGGAIPLLGSDLASGLKFRRGTAVDEAAALRSASQPDFLGRNSGGYATAVDRLNTDTNSKESSRIYSEVPATSNATGSLENTIVNTTNGFLATSLPAFNYVPRETFNPFSGSGQFRLDGNAIAKLSAPLVFGTDQPLTGNRTISGGVTAAGLVSPGNSPGKINITGDFSLLSTSILLIELAGAPTGIDYDVINVSGNVSLGGSQLNLRLLDNFLTRVQPGDTFAVVLAGTGGTGGVLSGTFGNALNGQRLATLDGGGSFQVNYGLGSAFANTIGPNTVVLSSFVAVPEPSTWVLMSAGSLFVAFILRRRKS